MIFSNDGVDIPEQFFNEESQKPFEECMVCEESLEQKPYFVEKAYKKYPGESEHQVMFEYAICQDCAEKKNSELSEESKENISRFMTERLLHGDQRSNMEDDHKNTHCIISGKDLKESNEYVSYGQFFGDKMIKGIFPYKLSGEVLEEITELLSKQTLGEIDDFIGEHFSGPPEFRELLRNNKKLVIL